MQEFGSGAGGAVFAGGVGGGPFVEHGEEDEF